MKALTNASHSMDYGAHSPKPRNYLLLSMHIGFCLYWFAITAIAAGTDDVVYECFSTEITYVNWDSSENGDRFGYGEEDFSIHLSPEIGFHANNWMLMDFSLREIPNRLPYWNFDSRESWSALSPDGRTHVRFFKGSLSVSLMTRKGESLFVMIAKCWG